MSQGIEKGVAISLELPMGYSGFQVTGMMSGIFWV